MPKWFNREDSRDGYEAWYNNKQKKIAEAKRAKREQEEEEKARIEHEKQCVEPYLAPLGEKLEQCGWHQLDSLKDGANPQREVDPHSGWTRM
jgi:hypothetical protein